LNVGEWDNTLGVIDAVSSSTVNVQGATLTGGTLGAGGTVNLQFSTNTLNGPITLEGTVSNSGTTNIQGVITNNAAWSLGSSSLKIQADTTLQTTGSGSITMSGGSIDVTTPGDTLVNGIDHIIQGQGTMLSTIGLMDNRGSILANVAGPALTVSPGGPGINLNTGVIRASTSGAILTLNAGEWDNTLGVIDAVSSSTVNVQGATLTGGTLGVSGGGTVNLQFSTNTLNGPITLEGTVSNSGTTDIQGVITNNADWTFSSSILGILADNTELQGSGTITMTFGNIDVLTMGHTLIHGASHTIQGHGTVLNGNGLINNQGSILANVAGPALIIGPESGTNFNTGEMRANISGAILTLDTGTWDNTGGTIEAVSGGTVNVNGVTLTGGTFNTSTGGVIDIFFGTSLGDFANTGLMRINPSVITIPFGTTSLNSGEINILSGAILDILGTLNVDCTGTITGPGTTSGNAPVNLCITCGISVGVFSGGFTNTIDYSSVTPGQVVTGTVGIINTGTSLASIEANTGADGAGGGFALLVSPFTTHISSGNMRLQVDSAGLTAMSPAGTDVPIGPLFGEGVLEVETTATVIGGAIPASTALGAVVNLSANC